MQPYDLHQMPNPHLLGVSGNVPEGRWYLRTHARKAWWHWGRISVITHWLICSFWSCFILFYASSQGLRRFSFVPPSVYYELYLCQYPLEGSVLSVAFMILFIQCNRSVVCSGTPVIAQSKLSLPSSMITVDNKLSPISHVIDEEKCTTLTLSYGCAGGRPW